MKQAFKMHRKAIESLYKGTCDIYEYRKYTDPETEETITELDPEPVYKNIPCKLSKKTITTSNQTEIANTIQYSPVLFIAPEIKVKPGSKIIVTQHSVTREFEQSGEPFVYTNHQEIVLQRTDTA
ncbi:ABC transporter ATP-binding protein [Tissierellaceae bacterium HCP3S3_D8]